MPCFHNTPSAFHHLLSMDVSYPTISSYITPPLPIASSPALSLPSLPQWIPPSAPQGVYDSTPSYYYIYHTPQALPRGLTLRSSSASSASQTHMDQGEFRGKFGYLSPYTGRKLWATSPYIRPTGPASPRVRAGPVSTQENRTAGVFPKLKQSGKQPREGIGACV